MGREIVADDMNLLALGLIGDDIGKKATNSALVCRATGLPTLCQI